MAAHFHKEKPQPPPPYTEKQKEWAADFLTTDCQYDLHQKKDDYTRTLAKKLRQSREKKSATGRKSSTSSAPLKAQQTGANKKRKCIPHLGEQAKQSIPPLKVLFEDVPELLLQQQYDEAAKLAAEMGVTVAELLNFQDNILPFLDVAPNYICPRDAFGQRREVPTTANTYAEFA